MSSTSGCCDQDLSDCSSSPVSYTRESPYSSPSQQVPQLTTLTCVDNNLYNIMKFGSNTPYLQIIEQPQDYFRFRYVSEMVGTHGCLLAKSSDNKTKKHPTVELVNYTGRALIRCRLAQENSPEEHPHKLLEDELDRDVSYQVPEKGIYKVGFPGMGIIHTAKKDLANLLFKKCAEQSKNKPFNAKEVRARCESKSKEINMNVVRLMFTAHDLDTGKEICPPVFSDPIHNMKSAATNDLKICRISAHVGRPRGGEDVFILVEKVNKKNIMIIFYELDETGSVVWSDKANFMQTDVHHQYAIVFRTPPYMDPKTPVDVKVYIQLVRPSDGRKSEPKEFTYKAEDVFKQNKKRKTISPYSSLSSSDGSISNLPVMVMNNHMPVDVKEEAMPAAIIQLPLQPNSPSECGLGNALNGISLHETSPMWSAPLPDLRLDSEEMVRISHLPNDNQNITDDVYNQYAESFNSSFSDLPCEMKGMGFIRLSTNVNNPLVADSGRVKVEPSSPSSSQQNEKLSRHISEDKAKPNNDYPAFYTPEEAAEVKELVKDLLEIIRTKKPSKNQEARRKLSRLFEIRLSNGDTFLHMTLCNNQASFETTVKMIHGVKMSHLLNLTNNKNQTILHLAVVNGSVDIIQLLIAKGCDPMIKDVEKDNAIHYAVRYNKSVLEPLLDAIEKHNVPFDLNDCNYEKQSSLHLCALYDAPECVPRLARAGASLSARDNSARTPLHLAAYDNRLNVLAAMLEHATLENVKASDAQGNTVLQIVCGQPMVKDTLRVVKVLLDKGVDPQMHEDDKQSAWKLSQDKPAIRDLMMQYVSAENVLEDDVKSEPEDEYESAEEDVETAGLAELNSYIKAVSAQLDAAEAWPELAERLNVAVLMSWFRNQPSPTYTLLNHVRECRDDITSKSLALILDDMGLSSAANIIKSHIE